MDNFRVGETILHTKLGVIGIVENEPVLAKHIGTLRVSTVQVQVGDDHLEWNIENVKLVLPDMQTIVA